MTKADLIKSLADAGQITQVSARNVLDELVALVQEGPQDSGEFVIPGLVKFKSTLRAARAGRNPRTGEALHVPEKWIVKAKALHLVNKL
jgi:DNA-binding protein HU-beta